ncbi:DUF6214 family protein [Streptomyces sp. NPDC053367]|uniref:DUF6214 family protein n=1 Tax=Streptomyces sp. NPDC053367 TaxID=3365700 RepID=UPI0037CF9101
MSVWPAWEVKESGGAAAHWFQVRLAFADGARVDALAVVSAGCLSVEDVRSQPALSLADLTVLADWIESPLSEACGIGLGEQGPDADEQRGEGACGVQQQGEGTYGIQPEAEAYGIEEQEEGAYAEEAGAGTVPRAGLPPAEPALHRARPSWPRGVEGRRLVAQEYRAAQEEGLDPVLAVMCATGHSRRRSLRLIAQARDAGFLTPRHARR